MEQQILELRKQGKSYNEIAKELNCSKSTVCYHLAEGQKERVLNNSRKRRKSHTLVGKLDRYRKRHLSEKARTFQRREGGKVVPRTEYNFTLEDLVNKIGENPVCYLSGREIDLANPKSYSLDHIKSANDEHDNSLDNLGITTYDVNRMKCHLSYEDFIQLCKEILEYQGYEIRKRGE